MTMIITKDSFESEVIKASNQKPVLVDFFAQWCMPCKMMSPILDELAEELDASAVIAKVDVDQERDLSSQFDIMSIPAMFIFKNEKVVEKIVGMQTIEQLKALIEKHK